jgi:hypothetical protein
MLVNGTVEARMTYDSQMRLLLGLGLEDGCVQHYLETGKRDRQDLSYYDFYRLLNRLWIRSWDEYRDSYVDPASSFVNGPVRDV